MKVPAARLQLEYVPSERPALLLGEILVSHHRAARNVRGERVEDLVDAGALLELAAAEVAWPGIEGVRVDAVSRASLSMTDGAPDGVPGPAARDQIGRPLRRVAGARSEAKRQNQDRPGCISHLPGMEPRGSGARTRRGGGRSGVQLRAR